MSSHDSRRRRKTDSTACRHCNMAPQDMHATLMAIKPPTPPAEDFLIEVQCQDGEEEPSYARVVAAVRKMCKKSDDAPIAIGISRARRICAR